MTKQKVQNIKLAIEYALNTPQGKKELNKTPFRDKTGNTIYRNPSMAIAMLDAISGKPVQGYNPISVPPMKLKHRGYQTHPKEEYSWLRKSKR